MSYSVPTNNGKLELNGVPVVMYFMTVPYFMSYHVFASCFLRRIGFWKPSFGSFQRVVVLFAMAYGTALMEAVSISAFPHYVSLFKLL